MIEVEKRFQPTEEQLVKLLDGAEFLGEKVIEDMYYDYPDYRLLKNSIRLRKRNGSFELKIGKKYGVAAELYDKEEIKKYFSTEETLEKFVESSLLLVMSFVNKRKEYRKEGFGISLDNMDFGFKLCEVETSVKHDSEVEEAEDRILVFTNKYGMVVTQNGKSKDFLKRFKPEVFKELYGKK